MKRNVGGHKRLLTWNSHPPPPILAHLPDFAMDFVQSPTEGAKRSHRKRLFSDSLQSHHEDTDALRGSWLDRSSVLAKPERACRYSSTSIFPLGLRREHRLSASALCYRLAKLLALDVRFISSPPVPRRAFVADRDVADEVIAHRAHVGDRTTLDPCDVPSWSSQRVSHEPTVDRCTSNDTDVLNANFSPKGNHSNGSPSPGSIQNRLA